MRGNYKRYVIATLLLTAAAVAAVALCCILLIRCADLADVAEANIRAEYAFRVQGDYDVLFFGDSSLAGVIPDALDAQLGLKTATLPLTAFSGGGVYKLVLARYLDRNPPPRLAVLYLTAKNPYFNRQHTYDKTYTLVRYGDPAEVFAAGINIGDLFETGKSILGYLLRGTRDPERLAAYFRNRGYCPPPDTVRLAADEVLDTEVPISRDDMSYIDAIRKLAADRSVDLMFYVAPLPRGDAALAYYRTLYAGVADNEIYALPNTFFFDFTHMHKDGALVNSEIVARAVQARLRGRP
ncbi:MAG: hypothetical protein H0S85_10970 [Desulfovibrionaceae bacterium]|jgi:hypothetical protein|nr:hypothetical protein [Desulfovibrionaceae bacterium]